MIRKHALALLALSCFVSPLLAAPTMTVVPQGVQAGNWVWQVNITPDLALAGGDTPLAVELGFRLTGDPLISVTNLSPLIFDTNLPGNSIFGWEIPVPGFKQGIEANCTGCTVTNLAAFGGIGSTVVPGSTNEIFAAMGSVDYGTPGPIPFLQIVAKGPGTGGPLTSTIDWLGAYSGNGRIAQIVGTNGVNFDISAGSATQSIPEPASWILIVCTALGSLVSKRRQRHA